MESSPHFHLHPGIFHVLTGLVICLGHCLLKSIHCCILYRIVSSPNYNWYPIYMVLVEKQASTSLISHSVYRDFHDGCYFSLAQWQRNLPKRNDSITNHSFKSHVSRNLQATLQVDITIRVNRRKSYHATLRFPHRAD